MNFTESRSAFYGAALALAGLATGIAIAIIVAVLMWGGWPADRYPQIISILGRTVMGGGLLMALVIGFLGLGGPAKNLKAAFGRFSIETEADE